MESSGSFSQGSKVQPTAGTEHLAWSLALWTTEEDPLSPSSVSEHKAHLGKMHQMVVGEHGAVMVLKAWWLLGSLCARDVVSNAVASSCMSNRL